MNAALETVSVTWDTSYRPPAIMLELGSSSAFNIDEPLEDYRRPFFPAPVTGRTDETVTMTDQLVQFFDPSNALAHELSEKAKRTQGDLQAYRDRIETLRTDAVRDGYGLNPASERDFWRFVRSESFIRKGNLVLIDNGNLRAVWKAEHGTHIGLQFLGGGTVQYVIFKLRAGVEGISRVVGRDSIEGVTRQIAAFDLRPLIYS